MQRIISAIRADNNISWISRRHNKLSEYSLPGCKHLTIKTIIRRGILFYAEFNLRLFFMLLFSKAEIISAVDLDTLPAAFMASAIKRKPLVFDAHEVFHEVPELHGKKFKRRIWQILSAFLMPRTDSRYTVNVSLAKLFEREFACPFEIIRNVPELKTNSSIHSPVQSNKTLVYLGVVNKGRGIELAVRALGKLEAYKLLIIGDGDCMEDIRKLVSDLNLQNRIEMTGYISPGLIGSTLAKGSIGLNMLTADSESYRLSLANKFFDYIHAGLPSVSMDFPEYRLINQQYEVAELVSEYSISALVNAILRLEKSGRYEKLQVNCIEARKDFNWQNESAKLSEIYNSL